MAITVKKRILFGLAMLLLALCSIEVLLSILYFQEQAQAPLATIHYIGSIGQPENPGFSPAAIGIWGQDERYGHDHIAGSSGRHRSSDFDVTYNIGENRERRSPQVKRARGSILFLGGSCTFGHGVDDDEPYPAILGREYWKQWGIQNRAVTGWGTSHAYMVLSDVLDSGNLPSGVIYGMIPHHLSRNYLRRSWLLGLASHGMRHPHFERRDGALVFEGLVNVEQSKPDGPEVRQKEIELTTAFISSMHQRCREKGIPFVVVLLPRISSSDAWPPSVIKSLYGSGIAALDLTELQLHTFPNDGHPNPTDHRRIAAAIAATRVGDSWKTQVAMR